MPLDHHQEERYFQRMAASVGDKYRVFPYLAPGSALDIGAGGGELSLKLQEEGYEVTALDGSEAAIEHIENLGINATLAFSHELTQNFWHETFDNVICSSILHEVYSYGDDNPNSKLTFASLSHTLKEIHEILKTHGMLIIRDGVKPAHNNFEEIHFNDPDGPRLMKKYLAMIPFRGNGTNEVNLEQTKANIFRGARASIMEALYTYTWDEDCYERETQELYGIMTLEEYKKFLEAHGFEIVEAYEYLQPGYEENLIHKATIHDLTTGEQQPYPSSNMIIAARKVG